MPTPLVTIALFMIPMAVSKMAVMIADRMPVINASAMRVGPMLTGLNMPLRSIRASRLVAQEVSTKATIAQQAA